MKTEVKRVTKIFTPVEIKFTIENEEDLAMIEDLFALNVSIPKLLEEKHRTRADEFLTRIHVQLNDI